MSRNKEGEFELMLGNKQLLSLFFLVVVLFAVFFSLGYMVGRSVGPSQTMAAQPAAPVESAPGSPPAVVPPSREPAPSPSPLSPPASAEPAPTAVVETQPARSEPIEAKEEAQTPKPSSPALVARELHLQVAAVRVQDDAEALVAGLKEKGYPVLLNSQTRDGWYRVMIGPFPNERAARQMRARLEKDGYKSIIKRP